VSWFRGCAYVGLQALTCWRSRDQRPPECNQWSLENSGFIHREMKSSFPFVSVWVLFDPPLTGYLKRQLWMMSQSHSTLEGAGDNRFKQETVFWKSFVLSRAVKIVDTACTNKRRAVNNFLLLLLRLLFLLIFFFLFFIFESPGYCKLKWKGVLKGRLLWSSVQGSWLQTQRSRVRFPAPPDLLRSNGFGTGSTQPHQDNWGTNWMKSSDSGL
jgi:hypothetical protein